HPEAAILLCSDGLRDVLTSVEISAIVEQYDGEASQIAQMLVDAANDAGGKDNVSVIFVAGAEFIGTASRIMSDARARHSITRLRYADQAWRAWLARVTWLVAGMILGALFWVLLVERRFTP